MPDLHGWITQQITRVEAVALAAAGDSSGKWTQPDPEMAPGLIETDRLAPVTYDEGHPDEAETAHITLHDPHAVLRRCEADRRILARHRLNPDAYWTDAAMCEGCGTEDEMACPRTENLNDCPELLDLGYAHGLTPEILATLDRPQEGERPEPGPGFQMPDVIAASFASFWLGTRPVEPRPEVKAMEILEPELKKIPGYLPTTEPEA